MAENLQIEVHSQNYGTKEWDGPEMEVISEYSKLFWGMESQKSIYGILCWRRWRRKTVKAKLLD
jgi:hypothetical protein